MKMTGFLPSGRLALALSVAAIALGIGGYFVARSGPNGYSLDRNYTLGVKPASQVLARRTVRQLAKGKSVTLSRDLFASEFVIRAEREGKRVQEIPIRIVEKRPPSINLFKRVPNVLKNVARLVYVIRVRGE